MDEQTADPFSVKNQLLHSKLHFDTGRVRGMGWGALGGHMHLHLLFEAQPQTPQTTRKHKKSHVCLIANFSRM